MDISLGLGIMQRLGGKNVLDLGMYDDAAFYDLLALPDPAATTFYAEEAARLGGKVLEIACGTGRLAIPLALRGCAVTGLDLHSGMIERARAAASVAQARVALVQADMREFALNTEFGLVFVAYNSLLHLHHSSDLISCFRAVARHLEPSGEFILEIFNPSPQWLALSPGERRKIGTCHHPTLGEVTVEQTLLYDSLTQVSRETWFYSTSEQPDFRTHPLELRNIYPQGLPLLLESGGLRLIKRFGGYDRRPFVSGSALQVCLCGRAA